MHIQKWNNGEKGKATTWKQLDLDALIAEYESKDGYSNQQHGHMLKEKCEKEEAVGQQEGEEGEGDNGDEGESNKQQQW